MFKAKFLCVSPTAILPIPKCCVWLQYQVLGVVLLAHLTSNCLSSEILSRGTRAHPSSCFGKVSVIFRPPHPPPASMTRWFDYFCKEPYLCMLYRSERLQARERTRASAELPSGGSFHGASSLLNQQNSELSHTRRLRSDTLNYTNNLPDPSEYRPLHISCPICGLRMQGDSVKRHITRFHK